MRATLFRSDAMSERHGTITEKVIEAEWFQLTYDMLRKAEDGETLARFDCETDGWFLSNGQGPFSDIVIDGGRP